MPNVFSSLEACAKVRIGLLAEGRGGLLIFGLVSFAAEKGRHRFVFFQSHVLALPQLPRTSGLRFLAVVLAWQRGLGLPAPFSPASFYKGSLSITSLMRTYYSQAHDDEEPVYWVNSLQALKGLVCNYGERFAAALILYMREVSKNNNK